MLRKMLSLLVTVTMFLAILPVAGAEQHQVDTTSDKELIKITARSAILLDYHSGQVMFSKNPDKNLPMASVTKLMTMLLACKAEAKGQVNLSDIIITSEHAAGMGGSQIYLEPGEELSFREMIIAIDTGSANDASVAVAEHLAGSAEAFIHMMNDQAKELGLENTNFVNTTGLPADNHYSSAADLAEILRQVLKYPLFRKVSSIYEYDLRDGEFKLWNTNKLLKWYPGCDAGKTGWTNEAKYCLAASAERDNLRLIAVVLSTSEPKSHFKEVIKLFNYGFARYQAVMLAKEAQKIKSVPVEKGTIGNTTVVASEKIAVVVPRGEDKGITGKVKLPTILKAPVKKGQVVGTYQVMQHGKVLTQVDLVATADIPKASPFQLMGRVLHEIFSMNK